MRAKREAVAGTGEKWAASTQVKIRYRTGPEGAHGPETARKRKATEVKRHAAPWRMIP